MPEAAYPPLRVAHAALILMVAAFFLSLLDRQILSLLVQPIKADLQLSDFEFSLLQGLAFVVLYSVAGLFLGALADRVSRRNLIMVALSTWSAATIACGLSGNFAQLFAARVAVGVGEAGLNPSVYSLICDLYAPRHRGRAFGVLTMSGSLGLAFALLAGGGIYQWTSAHHDSLPAMLQTLSPWRLTFVAAGVPGLVVAVLFLGMREPKRLAELAAGEGGGVSLKTFLTSNGRFLVPLIAHIALWNFCSYVVLGWGPAFYMRRFGVTVLEAGLLNGLILGVGSLGAVITGALGDRWIARRAFGGRLRGAILGPVLATPCVLVWFLSPNLAVSVVAGVLAYGAFHLPLSPGPLILADVTPAHLRGRATAILLLCQTLFGVAMGPLTVASLTDFVFRDEMKVNYSMLAACLGAMALSTVLALAAIRRYSATLYGESRP